MTLRVQIAAVSVCLSVGVLACSQGREEAARQACLDSPAQQRLDPRPEEEMQGRQLQGTKYQGTRYQGSKYQGNTRQGRTNQGNTHQGRDPQTETSSGEDLLHALNGVVLSAAATSDRLTLRGEQLLDANGEAFHGTLRARQPDGSELEFEVLPVRVGAGTLRYAVRHAGEPLCQHEELGLFVPGAWDPSGAQTPSADALTFACASGVIAKCVDWGYAPWRVGRELHQTCTRLARADYCGDGRSWTREGTLINLYDTRGIQLSEPSSELSFEAAWGPDGAVCVESPRYRLMTREGETALPPCWDELPRCDARSWRAQAGTLIANDSAHQILSDCSP